MDLLSTRERLRLFADLRRCRTLAGLFGDDKLTDWRLHPVQVSPGWIPLAQGMIDELIDLPQHRKIDIKFIEACEGSFNIAFSGDDSDSADRIIIAAKARALHICEWCGERGRYNRLSHQVLCRSHDALAMERPVPNVALEERLKPGEPYPRRKLLVGLVFGQQTLSGLPGAFHNEQGEHGFDVDHFRFLISWLTASSKEADLHVLNLERIERTLDAGLFAMVGENRTFELHPAEPALWAAARALGVTAVEIDRLIADADADDPAVRIPAFNRLIRIVGDGDTL